MKNISIAIATLFLLCSCSQRRQEIVVNNPATFDRTDEITEICADSITIAKAGEFIITDAEGGKEGQGIKTFESPKPHSNTRGLGYFQ